MLAFLLVSPLVPTFAIVPPLKEPLGPREEVYVGDLAADGRTVVGASGAIGGGDAFVWTPGTKPRRLLPKTKGVVGSRANAISRDGRTIVGGMDYADRGVPFRWSAGRLTILKELREGGLGSGDAVSGDGTVVVGETGTISETDLSMTPFRWDPRAGFRPLPAVRGGEAAAADVSDDGRTIVGLVERSVRASEAIAWTPRGVRRLGDLPGGTVRSQATAVSADGSVIVGEGTIAALPGSYPRSEATRWTAKGIRGLGIPKGYLQSSATSVTADGKVVLGDCSTRDRQSVFFWTERRGMALLQPLLEAQGLRGPLRDWRLATVQRAVALPGGGLALVGRAVDGRNRWRAYYARVRLPQ